MSGVVNPVATLAAAIAGAAMISALPAEWEVEAGGPVPGLTDASLIRFREGQRLFRRQWKPEEGIYSDHNAPTCLGCHFLPSTGGAAGGFGKFVFFSRDPEDPSGWRTFRQTRVEGKEPVERLNPKPGMERRRPQSLYGLGLVEAISDQDLLAAADPYDENGDQISGRLLKLETGFGRFGWRGHIRDLDQFARVAFHVEIGLVPDPNAATAGSTRIVPLTDERLKSVADYMRLLAAPVAKQRGAEEERGRFVFGSIGCASCHTPSHTTRVSPLAELNGRRIEPYSDFLLHEMIGTRSRHVNPPRTGDWEFRTPPLWGLTITQGPYWHDGSAPTVESAILKHYGEGLAVRTRYVSLTDAEKAALLAFLGSL